MESPDRKVKKGKRHPRVPIQTYKWEDVRRSRSKGGYPWTYLYKEPFDEELDPEPYTMEGMRKSRSSSTMGKSEVEIFEVMDTDSQSHTGETHEKSDDLQVVTEPDEHSIKHSSSSLVIEECDANDKEKKGSGIFFLESAESSDDISQYLDKEDRGPAAKRKDQESAMDVTIEEEEEKDEEPQTRKRKLSAESSYSRISQTKSAIMKTIRDTKAKIKVPKISFPSSKLKKPALKKKNSPPETKKDIKNSNAASKNVKPLYIHIPLKPPTGEKDEFSHLEFESDQTKKPQAKKPGSFKDLVKNLKQLKEIRSDEMKEETEMEADIKAESHTSGEMENNKETVIGDDMKVDQKAEQVTRTEGANDVEMVDGTGVDDTKAEEDSKVEEATTKVTDVKTGPKPKVKEKTKIKEDIKTDPEVGTDSKVEIVEIKEYHDKSTEEELNPAATVVSRETNFKMEHDDTTSKEATDLGTHHDSPTFGEIDPISFKRQEPPVQDISAEPIESEDGDENAGQVEGTKYDDMFDKLFAATSKDTETQTQGDRKGRSRSAEPERKRKISLESSYSRKSLSKLGFMKKLKDASDKIKRTLTRSTSKKDVEPKEEKVQKAVSKSKQLKAVKPIEPVYIHIPLKLPEGEKDEISKLPVDEGFKTPDTDSTTPDSPVQTGVQFIFLTAPSDDEVLDYNSSDVPETPSSENKLFFGSRINELKELAKGAVDEIACPKHKLDPVSEESSSEKVSVDGGNNREDTMVEELPEENNVAEDEKCSIEDEKTGVPPEEKTTNRDSNILVDEEDGLSEPKASKKENLSNEKTESDVLQQEQEEKPKEATESVTKEKDDESQALDLKSSLKGDSSPVMKKKVSFKRRSRVSKDGSYEDVQVISSGDDQKKEMKLQPGVLENTQSMSVEEKKNYLDDDIIKSEPLEEDFNKWSKMSDHEYEPVNPPPEIIEVIPKVKISENPTVCIINNDQIFNNSQQYNYTEEEAYKQDPAFLLKFQKDSKLVHRPTRGPNEGPSQVQLGEEAYMQDPAFLLKFQKDSKLVHRPTRGPNEGPSQVQLGDEAYMQDPAFLQKFQKDSKLVHRPMTGPNEGPSQVQLGDEAYMQDPAFLQKFQKDSKRVHRPVPGGTGKFQQAIKQRADNLKIRLHNIKKPHITLPDRPKFHKPNFQKFALPKIPDRAKLNLPSFSLPRRHNAKRPTRERHLSTESNDGDSKKPIFDFSTYPRIFKKKPRDQAQVEEEIPSFATVPRTKKPEKPETDDSRWSAGSDSVRVPLHSQDSADSAYREDDNKELYLRGDSIEENEPSHIRYDEDIDSDDEYERENRELNKDRDFLRRWDQGTYNAEDHEFIENMRNKQPRITDLDSPEDAPQYPGNNNPDHYSSGSSQGVHRQGVLEEINPDEFFLRQKGISQDNIEVGMYLSSEIREAFRVPANALSQMQGNSYELRDSNQSLPEIPAKRKSLKKPKRKKTPHTSQEKIAPYDEESAEDELGTFPPPRPTRRSRRIKKQKNADDIIPYQETISVDTPDDRRLGQHRESLGILGDDEQDEEITVYKNEGMEGREQPDVRIADPYRSFEFVDEEDVMEEIPAAPPRKQKSLKSLNMSESDSIMGDFSSNRAIFSSEKDINEPEVKAIRTESKIIIPIETDIPKRPSRARSRTNSQSRGNSQKDDESISLNTESIVSENQIPCVEEPCIKDLRDSMGYAIIDKSKARDPPLPPPRIPIRRKRSFRSENNGHFSTVPRPSRSADMPVRPLRNYSTLGQTRRGTTSNTYENKENIDISQYIEMEDEPNRDLQSGAVIKKMKDRPLPPPPRPPRKSRPFRDITSQENIAAESSPGLEKIVAEETEVSTQTEPLPDDFICEEVVQEPTDTIIIPTRNKNKPPVVQTSKPERKAPRALPDDDLCEETVQEPMCLRTQEAQSAPGAVFSHQRQDKPIIETRLITPTVYSYEETVTHGSLLVQPLDGAKLLPDPDISNVRTIPIHVDSDLEETSSIPEEFNKLTDPSSGENPTKPVEGAAVKPNEFDVLKAHKLQVTDLDVDKLTVNKLLADKIIVSEIDSGTIQTNDISSKTGALRVGEITLHPAVINQIIETIKCSQAEETEKLEVQKKTPISDCPSVSSPHCDEIGAAEKYSREFEVKTVEVRGLSDGPDEVSGTEEVCLPDIPEGLELPEQDAPVELSVQESLRQGLSARGNFHEESNASENSPEGLNKQEIFPGDMNVQENITNDSKVEENQPEQSNAPKSSEEKGKLKTPPEDMTVQEDLCRETEVQESQPEESDATKSPEQLIPQEILSRDSEVQESNSGELFIQDRLNDELNETASPPGEINEQGFSKDSQIQECLSEDFVVLTSVSSDLHFKTVQNCKPEKPNIEETPPKPPPRSSESILPHKGEVPPNRPPRQSEKHRAGSSSNQEESLQEPDVDDVPPPRPPQPQLEYIPSQPPASFYALRAQKYVDTLAESIPTVPKRRRHAKSKQLSRSSSEESSAVAVPSRRFHRRSSDLSVAGLTGQLVRVCGTEVNNSLKRLITYILNNVARNDDGKQDLNVMIMIVVVLIAGLILLGYGDEKTVVHLHHWEYFNPPGNA